MKRRNFLKLLPVGFLAAKFGGLVEVVKPRIVSVPFKVEIGYLPPVQMITSKEQAIELFGAGSDIVMNLPMDPEYEKSRMQVIEQITYV